jgi:FixJ family two-component response regulator
MTDSRSMVFIVDDEPSVCTALKRLIRSVGLEAQTFNSAKEFLRTKRPDVPSCLILDVRLPDLSGPDLQRELAEAKINIPIVFLTGHGDIPMSVRAIKAGAVEFLTKPFKDQDLLDAIQHGLEQDRLARLRHTEIFELNRNYESLTPREREVFPLVTDGFLNKQIADQLGASEKTIKVHRHQVMQKMKAESLAHLVRIAQKLGVSSPKS